MSIDVAEKRIANILLLKEGEKLPRVSNETMKIYQSYLSENLSFPFDAEYSYERGPWEYTYFDIKVTGILDINTSPDPKFYGLFCKGKQGRRKIEVPLAEIKVKHKGKNQQLIDDYRMWFWNYR